jgi:integrin alpha FG-GAP repeat containing protein 1
MPFHPPVGQLPQTSYHSLLTPYSFFGLGRTNNYIENLFVGCTKHTAQHFINMEGVIPNSKVVILPPPGNDPDAPWKRELYLRPGEWIPLGHCHGGSATIILAIIVFVLHLNEKVSGDGLVYLCSETDYCFIIIVEGR